MQNGRGIDDMSSVGHICKEIERGRCSDLIVPYVRET